MKRRGRLWLCVAVASAAGLLVGCATCGGGVKVREEGDGAELVVLLHGMKRSGRSMGKMAGALREKGYRTAVCGYPSKWGVHETSERVFGALGPVTSGVARVHYVTHSLGGILVRDAFRDGAPDNLGRVVMLGPPNRGCEHIDRFAWLPFFGAIWGTPARELGTGEDSFPNRLPPVGFECGVVAGTKGGLLGLLMPGPSDGKVTVERARAEGVKEMLVLPVNHTWMMRDGKVIEATARFLATGRFGEGAEEAAESADAP
ncbi:MAG: alpha/beta hydrolase [Kiritimatiellae bacterium]|nr:alpha/beta hydrolase [Kiritimatiellia bacterium]